jgi:hypothetical protein
MNDFILSAIKPSKAILPPRIVLYGTAKCGKTTFSSTIPNNLILDVEGGSGAVNVARVEREKLDTFDKFMGVLKAVFEQKHDFTSVTIDTADVLEQIIFTHAAKEHGKNSIADVGYGAGYVTAVNIWKQVLQGLDMLNQERKMMVILIAHDVVRRHDDPITESYDRYNLSLHDKTVNIIKAWADIIAFANNEVFVKSEEVGFKNKVRRGKAGERMLHLIESPAFIAGNRYGLPEAVPFSWEALSESLSEALMKGENAVTSELPVTGGKKNSKTKGE